MQHYSSDSSLSESEQSDVSSSDTVILNDNDDLCSDSLPDLAPVIDNKEQCFYQASVVVKNNVISLLDIYDNIDAFNDNDKFSQIDEVMKSINVIQIKSATHQCF